MIYNAEKLYILPTETSKSDIPPIESVKFKCHRLDRGSEDIFIFFCRGNNIINKNNFFRIIQYSTFFCHYANTMGPHYFGRRSTELGLGIIVSRKKEGNKQLGQILSRAPSMPPSLQLEAIKPVGCFFQHFVSRRSPKHGRFAKIENIGRL